MLARHRHQIRVGCPLGGNGFLLPAAHSGDKRQSNDFRTRVRGAALLKNEHSMSIFDANLGQRPASALAQKPAASDDVIAEPLSASKSLRAGIGLTLGERPVPLCPPVIVWPDALDGELEKTLAALPLVPPPISRVRPAEQALAEIDAALRRNSARVIVNGLFDLDDHHWDDR